MPTPGTCALQMPESPTRDIGCREPSQPVHSPSTWTSRALGAQTRKSTPRVHDLRAEHLPELFVPALVDEVDVELAGRSADVVGSLIVSP